MSSHKQRNNGPKFESHRFKCARCGEERRATVAVTRRDDPRECPSCRGAMERQQLRGFVYTQHDFLLAGITIRGDFDTGVRIESGKLTLHDVNFEGTQTVADLGPGASIDAQKVSHDTAPPPYPSQPKPHEEADDNLEQ